MRNAPHNTLLPPQQGADGADLLQTTSAWRIYLCGVFFVMAAAGVLVRIAWLQTRVQDRYLDDLERTTTEYEVIPARDGRILTESLVLATDVDRYDLQMHYRWLETPVNDRWLDRQVRNRLTRSEYRDDVLREKVEQQILALRTDLFAAVCAAGGLTPAELRRRCDVIQQRVERIAESVNARHAQPDDGQKPDLAEDSILMRAATALRAALTTPPRRQTDARIVVREEESFHTVAADVEFSTAAAIRENPQQFPGVRAQLRTVRFYPEGALAAHTVGARTSLRENESLALEVPDGRLQSLPEARRGRFGVERSYETLLKGQYGLRRIVRDRRQRVVSDEVVREPASGRDIVLTLNSELQRRCEDLLAEALGDAPLKHLTPRDEDRDEVAAHHVPAGGSIVVMEAATGRLLAAASAPGFDLSLFTGATAEEWNQKNSDPRRPFIARFSGMALPPGSTFKTLTAMAALESGVLLPDSTVFCQGYLDRPTEHRCLIFRMYGSRHGEIGIRGALAQSCNVFFFDVARRMGMATLSQWTTQMGFGQPTGVDLPFERSGSVPTGGGTSPPSASPASSRFEREALGLAIGQSRLTVTPLQMARLMAVVANRGWLVTPHIVSMEGMAHGTDELAQLASRAARSQVPQLHRETIDVIREGLAATVSSPTGTGYRAVRLSEVAVAGKTGTAETAPGKADHAWFAGYAPADDPQLVIVVVLEHGGSGSRAAGPVAREVARALHELRLLRDGSS